MLRSDMPQTFYLKDYKTPPYTADDVHLLFDIRDDETVITSRVTYTKNNSEDAPLVLNGEHLTLVSVTKNGETLRKDDDFTVDDKVLTLPCPAEESFELEIVTRMNPAENTRLDGLYKSGGTYCTQCEAHGFRCITYFQDRPDVMTHYTVRIEADRSSCPVLLSNGNLVEHGKLDGGRHFTVWHDPHAKPCYLFALVAGDLVHIEDHFTTMSGRDVKLRIYVRDGDQDQCHFAMKALKDSMRWDEEKYGREYDLDLFNIVAVSDFNMGAMENKSLNIFNTALVLAQPYTATDRDFERVEAVIAHEYFHNWTGNRITCRDWFQLSLKEGLTVFRDQTFTGDLNSHAVKRIEDVDMLRRMQFTEDAGPMAHPIRPDNYIEINNFYTVTVYEKGAEVIRMQHTLLGEDTYRKATDLYFKRHDGQAVTCEDFVKCMEDASGLDLSQFFLWYTQAGTPEIDAKTSYDADSKTFYLTLSQTIPDTPGQTDKKPMHIPVKFGLIGQNGEDLIAETVLELREPTQTFAFENIGQKPVPSILRGFSAPVKLTTDLTDEELRFLMVHDTDGFNKRESGQIYALRRLNTAIDAHENGESFDVPSDYLDSYGDILEQAFDKQCDKALLTLALTLPSITVIGQNRTDINPQAIDAVRTAFITAIVDRYGDTMRRIYEDNRSAPEFDSSFAARSRRSLQNLMLSMLCRGGYDDAIALAKAQYDDCNNMTDRIAALSVLADTDTDERKDALADYYDRFKDHQLAMDKWFNVQASASRDTLIDDVNALLAHPDFTYKTPNRVRSVFAAFGILNPAAFHREDGSGYEFLTDAIIKLNATNPQIAARLLTPLRDWKRYSPDRREKMKASLERIAATPDLSDNVYEVVTKSLKG